MDDQTPELLSPDADMRSVLSEQLEFLAATTADESQRERALPLAVKVHAGPALPGSELTSEDEATLEAALHCLLELVGAAPPTPASLREPGAAVDWSDLAARLLKVGQEAERPASQRSRLLSAAIAAADVGIRRSAGSEALWTTKLAAIWQHVGLLLPGSDAASLWGRKLGQQASVGVAQASGCRECHEWAAWARLYCGSTFCGSQHEKDAMFRSALEAATLGLLQHPESLRLLEMKAQTEFGLGVVALGDAVEARRWYIRAIDTAAEGLCLSEDSCSLWDSKFRAESNLACSAENEYESKHWLVQSAVTARQGTLRCPESRFFWESAASSLVVLGSLSTGAREERRQWFLQAIEVANAGLQLFADDRGLWKRKALSQYNLGALASDDAVERAHWFGEALLAATAALLRMPDVCSLWLIRARVEYTWACDGVMGSQSQREGFLRAAEACGMGLVYATTAAVDRDLAAERKGLWETKLLAEHALASLSSGAGQLDAQGWHRRAVETAAKGLEQDPGNLVMSELKQISEYYLCVLAAKARSPDAHRWYRCASETAAKGPVVTGSLELWTGKALSEYSLSQHASDQLEERFHWMVQAASTSAQGLALYPTSTSTCSTRMLWIINARASLALCKDTLSEGEVATKWCEQAFRMAVRALDCFPDSHELWTQKVMAAYLLGFLAQTGTTREAQYYGIALESIVGGLALPDGNAEFKFAMWMHAVMVCLQVEHPLLRELCGTPHSPSSLALALSRVLESAIQLDHASLAVHGEDLPQVLRLAMRAIHAGEELATLRRPLATFFQHAGAALSCVPTDPCYERAAKALAQYGAALCNCLEGPYRAGVVDGQLELQAAARAYGGVLAIAVRACVGDLDSAESTIRVAECDRGEETASEKEDRASSTSAWLGLALVILRLDLAITGAGSGRDFFRQVREHQQVWLGDLAKEGATREEDLPALETFLLACANPLHLERVSSDSTLALSPQERVQLEEGVFRYLELLPAYQLSPQLSRASSDPEAANRLGLPSLTTTGLEGMPTLDQTLKMMPPSELWLRAYIVSKGPYSAEASDSLVVMKLRHGERPVIVVKELASEERDILEMRSRPRAGTGGVDVGIVDIQERIASLEFDSSSPVVLTQLRRWGLLAPDETIGDGPGMVSVTSLIAEAERRMSVQLNKVGSLLFDGVVTPSELQDCDLRLDPPIHWQRLPWLAVPAGSKGEPLVTMLRSFAVRPLATPADAPRASASRTVLLTGDEFAGECAQEAPDSRGRLLASIGGEFGLSRLRKSGDRGEVVAQVIRAMSGADFAHVIAHLDWSSLRGVQDPVSEPHPRQNTPLAAGGVGDNRFNLSGLVEYLLSGARPDRHELCRRVVLETCRASETRGRVGGAFGGLALLLLASGPQEILAPIVEVYPLSERSRGYWQKFYAAYSQSRSLAEASVSAARSRYSSDSARSEFDRLAVSWSAFVAWDRLAAPEPRSEPTTVLATPNPKSPWWLRLFGR